MFTIGEFSKITGMTVKTLRFYHGEGLLVPSFIDPRSGYRHYDSSQIESARLLAYLRGLEFPLSEIKELLRRDGDDDALLDAVERHKAGIEEKIRQLRKVSRSLEQFLMEERQAADMARASYEIQEKLLEPALVGGIRMKGRYSECGKAFGKLGRLLGRFIRGKPLLLHYDTEYKEDDADFEACFPIRAAQPPDGVAVRELPGGPCLSLLHKGPYEQLGHSYARILQHVNEKGHRIVMPTREIYIKGPGMIFKGNPRNYLTEIQIPIEGNGAASAARSE